MAFDPSLSPGDTLIPKDLNAIFKGQRQGGIRFSKETRTVLVVSDHTTDKPFHDRWDAEGTTFHYTAQGPTGDQDLTWAMNPALHKAKERGLDVFLFEKFKPSRYTFIGQVELAEEPYQEEQAGDDYKMRLAWVFPLRLTSGGTPPPIPQGSVKDATGYRERRTRKLSESDLRKRAEAAPSEPPSRQVTSTQYERDAAVAEYVKSRAKGKCDLCGKTGPFPRKDGTPYLECHHVVWISKGGEDSPNNAVALCPNCHTRMHVLRDRGDVGHLKRAIRDYV